MIAASSPLSAPAKVFLIVHVAMAVIMVGTGYVYPILMANMKARGPNRVPLLRVMNAIARAFTTPFIFIQPLTGLGLILTTRDRWNPFHATNRWLFASIVLFVVIFVLDTFVAGPAIRRMYKLAEAGDFDSPALERDLGMLNKVGPVFGILFVTITVLMIWKPGGPDIHF
jgi:hypothetical protein